MLIKLFTETPGLFMHAVNVFMMVEKVIKCLPTGTITDEDAEDLLTAALYHDIGKSKWQHEWFELPLSAISDDVLNEMRVHPVQSLNILKSLGIPISKGAQKIILQHHERPDSNGYPFGVEPDNLAMAFAACDIYCACREVRAYRSRPLPVDFALREASRVAPLAVLEALAR